MIEYFCECETPAIHIVEWSESTWALEKGQSYQECLKCVKIIENTLKGGE